MARVNLEDHAFGDPRLVTLATELLRLKPEVIDLVNLAAIGILARLWHESQSEMMLQACSEQIEQWTTLQGSAAALKKARYLKDTDGGDLRIVGNEHQIAGLESRKIKARAAAKKRWEKTPDAQPMLTDAPSMLQASGPMLTDAQPMLAMPNTNSNTNSKINTNTKKKDPKSTRSPPPASADGPTEGTLVWRAYEEAMVGCWKTQPSRNAKTAKNAVDLIRLVGFERALALAAYYPTRRKQYYIDRGFPFGLLLTDHPALEMEMDSGVKLTKDVVKDIVRKESSEQFDNFVKIGIIDSNPLALTDDEQHLLGEG